MIEPVDSCVLLLKENFGQANSNMFKTPKEKFLGLFPLPINSVIWMLIGIPNPTHVVILLVTIGKGNNRNIFLIWTPSQFLSRKRPRSSTASLPLKKWWFPFGMVIFSEAILNFQGVNSLKQLWECIAFAAGSPPKESAPQLPDPPRPGSGRSSSAKPLGWSPGICFGFFYGKKVWHFLSIWPNDNISST